MYFIHLTPQEREAGLVAITRNNVRTFCPKCGSIVTVDLQDFIGDEGFRLAGSSVLCPECSEAEMEDQVMQHMFAALFGNNIDQMNKEDCFHE